MSINVTVLRVFTDGENRFGNPLGLIALNGISPPQRQAIATQLAFSETVYVSTPSADAKSAVAQIFTPAAELPFAGHPAVGAAWWLHEQGTPVHTLHVPAGLVEVEIDANITTVRASTEWAPEFVIDRLDDPDAVTGADADDYADDFPHYVWAWIDEPTGRIRARSFAPEPGVAEDEATGAGAMRLAEQLLRDVTVTQGKGSVIHAWWSPDGTVRIGGRVVIDRVIRLA